jgi:CheY-like chemotaxis protein
VNAVFLIVDSSGPDAAEAARLLSRVSRDAEVLEARGGREAIELLKERRVQPSLIFAEYSLADMTGVEFLGALRTIAELSSTPAVMLSATTNDKIVTDCFRLGARGYLTKPTNFMDLKDAVSDFAKPAVRLADAAASSAAGQRVA